MGQSDRSFSKQRNCEGTSNRGLSTFEDFALGLGATFDLNVYMVKMVLEEWKVCSAIDLEACVFQCILERRYLTLCYNPLGRRLMSNRVGLGRNYCAPLLFYYH